MGVPQFTPVRARSSNDHDRGALPNPYPNPHRSIHDDTTHVHQANRKRRSEADGEMSLSPVGVVIDGSQEWKYK